MERKITFRELNDLLMSLQDECPEIREFRDWPRLFSLVREAPADAEITHEVVEASMKVMAALESLEGRDPMHVDWESVTLSMAPGVGTICDSLLKGGITPPLGPCKTIKRTILDVAGPARREKPL